MQRKTSWKNTHETAGKQEDGPVPRIGNFDRRWFESLVVDSLLLRYLRDRPIPFFQPGQPRARGCAEVLRRAREPDMLPTEW